MSVWNNNSPIHKSFTHDMVGSTSLGQLPTQSPPPYQGGSTPVAPSPVGQIQIKVTAKQNSSFMNALKFLYNRS